MGDGAKDDIKGRVKEAAGALTDDEKLRNEGRLDQAVGKVKDELGKAVDKVRDALTGDDDEDGQGGGGERA